MRQASIRKLEEGFDSDSDDAALGLTAPATGASAPASSAHAGAAVPAAATPLRATERWADATVMLKELGMEQYIAQFEEEEMTSMQLLEEIACRSDGEKELMEALKEMGIKKMGHRQTIVGAVVGKL